MRESFRGIEDKRQQFQVSHDLYEIIAMTIAAVIGNCDGWEEIEDFCISKEAWLREHMGLKLEHGIPSERTFARVWGWIAPEAFKKCFTQWAKQVHEKITGEIVSIDGKTICGSKSDDRRPIHMITAWVSEQEMVLGQLCVEEKTNEITTVPLLLKLLDINGCIVTADARTWRRLHMPCAPIGGLRMVCIIAWMYHSMKVIPASEKTMPLTTWPLFVILHYLL